MSIYKAGIPRMSYSPSLLTICKRLSTVMSTSIADVTCAVPGVFRSLPSILSVLEEHSKEREVLELLEIYHRDASKTTSETSKTNSNVNYSNHPLVVFEGLDGSGKSLLTKLTAKKLGGVKSSTPPESVKHLRPYFDGTGVDRVLRRAFYSLGNYLAARDLQRLLESSPVVMDRFWHSTAAYAIAELKDSCEIPENTFAWPSDLLQPDLVVFLTVSEDVRLERMSRRKNFTLEEDKLKENSAYRQRLTDTYAKMKKPSLKFLNCDRKAKVVVEDVMTLLRDVKSGGLSS
uniref:UMP-CMP kinase 2, mitochondrial n=1 Tax=Lygus hesperus TaxID=30085 RepID=A0A0A9WWY0_LYGHE